MLLSKESNDLSLKIFWPIVFCGGVIGLMLSWSVLVGDQHGRVNLSYLLLVYLVIPIISVLVSLVSIIFGNGINLARLLTNIPFWSFQTQTLVRKVHQLKLDKHWFLMQSQAAAIAFSIASLMIFFLMLLTTDVNFVWRSTILNASDLLPFLEFIAKPWSIWNSAQPNLQLLQLTQDSRLVEVSGVASDYAGWWQFILATQLVYSLLLRSALFFVSRWWITRTKAADLMNQLHQQIASKPLPPEDTFELSPVIEQIPPNIAVTNWAGVDVKLLASLPDINLNTDNSLIAGPHATAAQQRVAERWQAQQLVIVKAWEPPLGELEDYLQNGKGYLLPLDWNQNGLVKPRENHLDEWRRLAHKLSGWQLYQPKEL